MVSSGSTQRPRIFRRKVFPAQPPAPKDGTPGHARTFHCIYAQGWSIPAPGRRSPAAAPPSPGHAPRPRPPGPGAPGLFGMVDGSADRRPILLKSEAPSGLRAARRGRLQHLVQHHQQSGAFARRDLAGRARVLQAVGAEASRCAMLSDNDRRSAARLSAHRPELAGSSSAMRG